jgi:cytochrome c556
MAMIAVAGLCAGALGTVALGQGTPPLPKEQHKETIFARKILMDSIGRNMDELEANASSTRIDLAEGRDHADTVSVMLMTFPHLFPPSTNEWKPNVDRDPGTDTFAAPEIWTGFADFYKRARDAADVAFKASRAETEPAFKDQVARLRLACDSCHAIYMKKN